MRPWLFIVIINFVSIFAQECLTPNGVRAECTLIDNCDPVNDFIDMHKNSIVSPAQLQYLNLLQCYEDDYGRTIICCARDDPFFEETRRKIKVTEATVPTVEQITQANEKRVPITDILPNSLNFECGADVLSNRIVGGTDAELGEFPWLALLEYQHPNTNIKSFSCGGSLIHRRYVLTAAHCTTGAILRLKGNLVNVRLGEHNLNTTVDCEYFDGKQLCATPVVDVGVEYAITYPNYTQVGIIPYNDIALVRLAYDIETTAYIQPICFPSMDVATAVGMSLTVAGWGRISRDVARSDIKQKVGLPVIDFSRCQETFYPVMISQTTQICAGAQFGKDSCNGDSGGPLMLFNNGFWFIEGIVSFGLTPCGLDGISGIYTRVNAYTDWILSTIII